MDEEEDTGIEPPSIPDAMLDSWMLQHFPGRFLDEVSETMDIFRFLRALQARNIESIEDIRKQFRQDKLKAENITEEQWKQIKRHDKIMAYLQGE